MKGDKKIKSRLMLMLVKGDIKRFLVLTCSNQTDTLSSLSAIEVKCTKVSLIYVYMHCLAFLLKL